jgi:uncharacterized membrane-anchored protein
MSPRLRALIVVLLAALTAPSVLAAQTRTLRDLPWVQGPVTGDLGSEATARVPAGCYFVGPDAADDFMILTQNPPGGNERGVIFCEGQGQNDAWFVVFSFDPSGYVKDDERDELDADALLKTLKRGNEAGNEERRSRGWATLELEGWVQPPFYDAETNNLTWSLSLRDNEGDRSVNHSVRLLGRGGVMHADLVADHAQLAAAIPAFNGIVAGYAYKSGHRYSEWRAGDKVAAFGLTALIAGGAGAVAAKTGLLKSLWKLIVAGVAAIGAGIKALFGKKKTA